VHNGTIRLKIDTNSIRMIRKEIQKGIEEGVERFIGKVKYDLIDSAWPDRWRHTGPMEIALAGQGLDSLTYAGRLQEAWGDTIQNIRIDKRRNNVVLNLFNSEILDEKTVWIGLKYRPGGKGKAKTQWQPGEHKQAGPVPKMRVPAVFNGGYRPIGRGKGKGWTWELNPYPEHGYWLLYEQGWGQYKPHNFIKEAYGHALFGASAAQLVSLQGSDVTFTQKAIEQLGKDMVNKINAY